MKCKKLALRVLSTAAVLSIVSSIAAPAFADVYDLTKGDISVGFKNNQQTVTQTDDKGNYISDDKGAINDRLDNDVVITTKDAETGKVETADNTVKIDAAYKDSEANVTLRDTSIDVSGKEKAAISISGDGKVNLELDGKNTVISGNGHAGIEKGAAGTLTIKDEKNDDGTQKTEDKNDTGHLTANGGEGGAGIGGSKDKAHTRGVSITGGEVTANGGEGGAGIGGGKNGSLINAGGEISGGKVTATGGKGAAGIGGGEGSYLNGLTITGGEVTANGGEGGAGIGSGKGSWSIDVKITGGKVTATGNGGGAGIGGGDGSAGMKFLIDGKNTVVTATGNGGGAGIGGGNGNFSGSSNASRITEIKNGTVTAISNGGGAGIGGGKGSYAKNDIKITGGTVTAESPDGGAGIGSGKDGSESTAEITLGSATDAKIDGVISSNDGSAYAKIKYTTSTGNTYTSTAPAEEHREEPTCEANGKIYYTITYMNAEGQTVTENFDGAILTATGHNWVVNKDGTMKECSICHKQEVITQEKSDETPDTTPSDGSTPETDSTAEETVSYAPLRVVGAPAYEQTVKDGRVLIAVPAQSASLTGSLHALKELKAKGAEVLVFRTQLCESTVSIDTLLAQGTDATIFTLTHTEGAASLTVGGADHTDLLNK